MAGDARRRWAAPAAAAAVLVVVAGAALAWTCSGDEGPPDSSALSALTETRVVSFRDVAVDVPADWVTGFGPRGDWCADVPGGEGRFAKVPYVQTGYNGTVLMIGCPDEEKVPGAFGGAPSRLWAPHVELVDRDSPGVTPADGALTFRGWTLTSRTVGEVQVRVISDASVADLVTPILDSAHVEEETPEGCETTSPGQSPAPKRPAAFDVTTVAAVDTITICQYRRITLDRAGFHAARTLTGDEAARLLADIQEAPVGNGPERPNDCGPDDFGEFALVLRLSTPDDGSHDLYVGYSSCRGNGFDDGTNVRELTRESCGALWGEQLQRGSMHTDTSTLCRE